MKKFSLVSVFFVLIFTVQQSSASDPTGVYGVCACSNDDSEPRLLIKNDQTFLYRNDDNTFYTGTWSVNGNYIYLADKTGSFRQRWKLNREGTCIKSREALLFRRICKAG